MDRLIARFAGLPQKIRVVVIILLGVITALGQAPVGSWPLTVAGLACLFVLWPQICNQRHAAISLWAFGFGYFGFALHWIIEPFLVDVARHGWMAPFAPVLMAGGGALFWALAGWAAARAAPGQPIMLALLLVGAETLRSYVFTGFPWALLGHVWIDSLPAQLAALGGPHLLSLLTVIAALLTMRTARVHIMLPVVVLGIAGYGLRDVPASTRLPDDAPMVRLVQPNVPQDQKWASATRDMFLVRLLDQTAAGPIPDLVVWPETAVTYALNSIANDLLVLANAARGAPLVFGIQRLDGAGAAYNSMVVLDGSGRISDIYDKRHLVPFGEYIPGARLLGQLAPRSMAQQLKAGFAPGDKRGPIMIDGIGPALPLICYEGIFAEELAYGVTRPRLMVLITNDAWFGQWAGPRQHLAQARLRAIEQGLPMVRVANTGISAMIDGRGRITASLPLGVMGTIDAALPSALPPTIYSQWGDFPFFALLGALIAITWARRDRH